MITFVRCAARTGGEDGTGSREIGRRNVSHKSRVLRRPLCQIVSFEGGMALGRGRWLELCLVVHVMLVPETRVLKDFAFALLSWFKSDSAQGSCACYGFCAVL